jgi:hypothetical protein
MLHVIIAIHALITNQDHIFDDLLVGVFVLLVIVLYFYLKVKRQYTRPVSFFLGLKRYRYIKILKQYFPFYNRLPQKEKHRFLRRVDYFISIKTFVPIGIEKVTPEMQTLIAACAIELTYGLPEVYLSHFKTIDVYPNNIPDRKMEFSIDESSGRISLSWSDFLKGYVQPSGSYNYAIHEMARALHIENRIKNDEYCFMKEEDLKNWKDEADEVLKTIISGQETFFGHFKGNIETEFFSVVVESFFERPIEFHESLPELYRLTSILLNQNPLALYPEPVQ